MISTAPTLWQRICYTRLRDAVRGRFDASLDWRPIVAAANLPATITDVVTTVVRRTRLWKREKVDVARELVAHFQDGLECGRDPAALIASFGDPQQTAALIRRAKKRGRSLTWHVWHYGWMSVAALALAYVVTGLYMMTGRPTIRIDYLARVNERAAAVPEPERAWPLYRASLLAMGVKQRGAELPDEFVAMGDARPGDTNWPTTQKFLRDHADEFAKLRAAAGRRELGFVTATSFAAFTPEDRELFGVTVTPEEIDAFKSQTVQDRWLVSTLLPYLHVLRSSALLLSVDARHAAAAGDADTAMADTVAMLGVVRHCQEMPCLMGQLVASTVENRCCNTIQETLTDHADLWSEEQLRDLAHSFAASKIDWRQGFAGETAIFHDIMQRFYTDDGHGDGRLAFRNSVQQNIFQLLASITSPGADDASAFYYSDGMAMLMLPAANLVIASRKDTTQTYERFIGSAIEHIETPYWKQHELLQPNDRILTNEAGAIERFRYLFIRLMLPAFERLRHNVAREAGERDGTLIGLALEVYHREHKSWPKSLDELSPRYLPQVPVDLITGGPLHYKIVEDRPVVYSVGVDKDDDEGRLAKNLKGELHPEYAAPNYYEPNHEAVRVSETDGDWVIWSTANNKVRGQQAIR